MMSLTRNGLAVLALVFCLVGPVAAEDSLDKGKSGAQLYAANCAACHKTPQTLKSGGIFGLSGFLREHYTASRESAAAIAAYVESTGRPAAAPPKRTGPSKRTAKGDDKAKAGAKPDTKSNVWKPTQDKAAEPKPAETKPAETKPSEPKADAAPPAKPDEAKKPD